MAINQLLFEHKIAAIRFLTGSLFLFLVLNYDLISYFEKHINKNYFITAETTYPSIKRLSFL